MAMRNQKGLATWVKILIGVMIVGFISVIAIVGSLWYVGTNIAKDLTDPVKIRAAANTLAKFEDPLPTGWTIQSALDLMGMKVLIAAQKPGKTFITMLSMPKGKDNTTADQVIDEMAVKGVNVPNVGASSHKGSSGPISISSKEKMLVGGEQMVYGLGKNSDDGETLLGCILPKGSSSAIIISASGTDNGKLDMEGTKKFLGAIKGF
ncbi:MAG: hypothetical protein IAF58_03745 [Leptolyngbya sp.]|nr:hypothetical protein [Candidatus Melainabacteria bacterium]